MLLSALFCRSFEEMEAQITAGMKTPVLGPRAGPEGSAGDKGRKRESEPLSQIPNTERDEQVRLIHFVLFENVKPQNAALYVGQEEITSFVLLPLCIKKCLFLSLSLNSLLSHKRSVYTLFLETLRPSFPVTNGATFLNLSRRSVTLDTQLKVNNSASRTKTLGSCFCHNEPCPPPPPPLSCPLPNPPGAPVAPHTGPIGGPCPRTGLARKPV